MNAPSKPDSWVWLARIRRAQGRKGEVLADILTDFPQKFAERRHLWLLSENDSATSERAVELVQHWLHKGGIVLHFAGIDSISAAELLTGQIVAIPLEARAPLAEDEVYIADLIGCSLVNVAPSSGRVTVGRIQNVERDAGPVPLLMVKGETGEILVPFTKSFLRSINLPEKRIEMSLPEGLVDLNR